MKRTVELAIPLCSALAFLHDKGLIHRDVKPSNVIFVNGVPKFADIGLVTEMETTRTDVTFVGTEGFMAPEGPGTARADVYSMGILLYEISSGHKRQHFPALPTNLGQRSDAKEFLRLNEIILKACERDPARRYQSAGELQKALASL